VSAIQIPQMFITGRRTCKCVTFWRVSLAVVMERLVRKKEKRGNLGEPSVMILKW